MPRGSPGPLNTWVKVIYVTDNSVGHICLLQPVFAMWQSEPKGVNSIRGRVTYAYVYEHTSK